MVIVPRAVVSNAFIAVSRIYSDRSNSDRIARLIWVGNCFASSGMCHPRLELPRLFLRGRKKTVLGRFVVLAANHASTDAGSVGIPIAANPSSAMARPASIPQAA